MAFSTGRGGAGNIKTSTTITSENNDLTHIKSKSPPTDHHNGNGDKKFYYATGRGGAGNIKSSDTIPSPKLVPQGSNTPQLHGDKITTGRGGYGNMFKNSDPELTRKLQDVEGSSKKKVENELHQVSSNKSFSVGRGGFGNVISNTKSRSSQNSGKSSDNHPNNLMAISSHGNNPKITEHEDEGNYDMKKKRSFIGKLKGIFQT